jgi:alkylation response protein AidB-like acyl-CoA dehydrogenase
VDFSVTAEQAAFRRSVFEWAREVVAPGAADRDKAGRWDPAVWESLARQELAGLPIPVGHGGAGGSIIDCCLANEAIGEGGHDGGLNLSLGAHWVIGTVPIWLHGTPAQQAAYLPRLCSGEWIGAWASTEPEAGSDAGALRTTAVRDGDTWVINGTKMFITNGPIADLCTVLAVTDPAAGPGRGVSAFLVETTNPGYAAGPELDKMGCRSSPTAEVVLTDCRVPADAMLGPEGEALWRIAFECFDWERTVMIAGSVGGMAATLDASVAYAKERRQFGKPIASFQAIAHKLADMKINLEVCRTAVYRAAFLKQQGEPHTVEASIAKTLVGDLSVRNALDAIQIHGGYGYLRDFPAERSLRDAKLTSIGGGTTEIQKMIISRALLGDG